MMVYEVGGYTEQDRKDSNVEKKKDRKKEHLAMVSVSMWIIYVCVCVCGYSMIPSISSLLIALLDERALDKYETSGERPVRIPLASRKFWVGLALGR